MRRLTKANIRILPKDSLPKIASEDDEMVQVDIQAFSYTCILIFFSFLFLVALYLIFNGNHSLLTVDQISGDLDLAKDALVQVTKRLRANLFDREGAVSAFVPVLPYLPMPENGSDSFNYESRESKRHARGHPYSGGYSSSDLGATDRYGSYGGSQVFQ